ncbi:MAG: ABC transporter permease subunit [Clostridia bacterium]
MTILLHELKQNRVSFGVWTAAIGFLLAICVFMFPEMEGEMEGVTDMFSSMGSFTAAFGMDRLDFGSFIGFYAVECGNILGLGGAFFAALIGISALVKEEKERTAEFLLAHPVSRAKIVTDKFVSVMIQIVLMNLLIFGIAVASTALIGEEIPWRELGLLHLANLLLQIEVACICFGISAFLRRGGLGIGLGLAAVLYFLNIIANISEKAEFLKYFTPFGYTEGADILTESALDGTLILVGILGSVLFLIAAYVKYCKKDIV